MTDLFAFSTTIADLLPSLPSLLAATELPEPSSLAAFGKTVYNVALVVIGLGFVIFVHELGHFLAAKTFGVKCEKFYIGFDVPIRLGPIKLPAKLVHFQWGETEYGIGAIPLGGYVKMLGQDDDPRKTEAEAKRIRQNKEHPADVPKATQEEAGVVEQVAAKLEPTSDQDAVLDPRSYPAKPVYARMIIISAGVIMNLIFGVFFAAAAFMVGVPYSPAVVGDVVPGDPAWVNGIRPGDRIVQVSTDLPESKQLRFNDMAESVILHGIDDPDQPMPIVIERGAERIERSFAGTRSRDLKGRIMTLGVIGANTTEISDSSVFEKQISYDAKNKTGNITLPDFQLGEKIVGIDGHPLADFGDQPAPALFELNRYLDPKFDQAVTVTIASPVAKSKDGSRSTPAATREVTWTPMPRRSLGLSLAVGPITSIAKGSPAEQASVGLNDRPIKLNGEPIVDGLTLHLAVAKLAGQQATLSLKRMSDANNEEIYDFSWDVPTEFQISTATGAGLAVSGNELVGSGLVVGVLREVSAVDENSMAQKAGLQVGDVLQQVRVLKQTPDLQAYLEKNSRSRLFDEQPLDGYYNALFLDQNLVQRLPFGSKVELTYLRKTIAQATVEVIPDDWMSPDRGIQFTPMQGTYKVSNFGEAMTLGGNEVIRRVIGVADFLRMLVTGKMQLNMLGGPGAIFYIATKEASEGSTRLLLFLTMLSANLAVINFLPIPALDGGHMMFLAAEAVLGKPVNETLQMQLTLAGVLGLLCLMAFVLINDTINLTNLFSVLC